MNDIRRVLSYNDVSMIPRYSDKRHLSEADLIFNYDKLPMPFSAIPIINAPMDKVCSKSLLQLLYNFNMPVTIHRWFDSVYDQLDFLNSCGFNVPNNSVFLSVGSLQKWRKWIDVLIEKHEEFKYGLLVDVANGDALTSVETVKYIRGNLPNCNIMAGNIATRSGYARLEEAGANLIRSGIGGGSVCTTRIKSGFGVPTLTTVMDCAKIKSDDSYLIADGGIEFTGDIAKAMAAGADMVMSGKLFAATSLSSGMKFDSKGRYVSTDKYSTDAKWVNYTGMASKEAQEKLKTKKTFISIEGMSNSIIPYVGDSKQVVDEIVGNLKSSMSYYGGCSNWKEFKKKIKFAELTTQGWGESLPRVNGIDKEFEK